jgi:chromosome segregation ATPase
MLLLKKSFLQLKKKVFSCFPKKKMSDEEDDFAMVEHELHAAEHTDKPMVELEIARSVTGAGRTRISHLEDDLSDTKTELGMMRAQAAKQALVIASLQKVVASRDLTLQHCTASLIETNAQFQESQDAVKQLQAELQTVREQLTQLEIQYELTRSDLKKECQEFKAYKQCIQNKPRRPMGPADQVMSTERKFINNLFEPSLFR